MQGAVCLHSFYVSKVSCLFVYKEQFFCMIFADRHNFSLVAFQPEVTSQFQFKDTSPMMPPFLDK